MIWEFYDNFRKMTRDNDEVTFEVLAESSR
jgi:hypothetical protein